MVSSLVRPPSLVMFPASPMAVQGGDQTEEISGGHAKGNH